MTQNDKHIIYYLEGTANRRVFIFVSFLCFSIPTLVFSLITTFAYFNFFFDILLIVITIMCFLSFLKISIKRLHATGHSGWWSVFYITPLAPILFLFLSLYPNSNQINDYKTCKSKPKLISKYESIFLNAIKCDAEKAKAEAGKIFKISEKEVMETGTGNLPHNLGLLIVRKNIPDGFQAQEIYYKTLKRMTRMQNEGVNEKDIITWWNLTQIERLMSIKSDEEIKLMLYFIKYHETSLENPTMKDFIKHNFPVYDYEEQDNFGPDNPLPYELKERIESFLSFKKHINEKRLQEDAAKFTSYNAFIRDAIKNGKI